jgi:hypothetical protein
MNPALVMNPAVACEPQTFSLDELLGDAARHKQRQVLQTKLCTLAVEPID